MLAREPEDLVEEVQVVLSARDLDEDFLGQRIVLFLKMYDLFDGVQLTTVSTG